MAALATSSARRLSPETLLECAKCSGAVARTFFPDVFFTPLNRFHREIFDTVDAVDPDGIPLYKKLVIAAPRGLGKTSCVSLAYAARQILHKRCQFLMYLTASSQVAITKTETLKRRLLGTPAILGNYGSIRTQRVADMEEDFSKTAYLAHLPYRDDESYIGTYVVPRGAKQQVRSSGYDKARPDRLLGDDLDDPRFLKNEEMREEVAQWWFGDVLPAVSRYDTNYQFVYIGTMTHRDSLLARLLRLSSWKHVKLSVCDQDFRTIEPLYMSQKELDEFIAEYDEAGMLDVFRREFMNQDDVSAEPAFSQDQFKYYEETEEALKKNPQVESVVLIDPAKTKNWKNAHSAIVGVGVNRMMDAVYARDVVAAPMYPDEMYAAAIDMAKALGARTIACEDTGLEEFIRQPFQDAVAMSGWYGELVWLKARGMKGDYAFKGGRKLGHVAGLVPYYRKGLVYHNRSCCRELEAQLLGYPDNLKRWDIIDAFANVVQWMNVKNRRMVNPAYGRGRLGAGAALARLRQQQERSGVKLVRSREGGDVHTQIAAEVKEYWAARQRERRQRVHRKVA